LACERAFVRFRAFYKRFEHFFERLAGGDFIYFFRGNGNFFYKAMAMVPVVLAILLSSYDYEQLLAIIDNYWRLLAIISNY